MTAKEMIVLLKVNRIMLVLAVMITAGALAGSTVAADSDRAHAGVVTASMGSTVKESAVIEHTLGNAGEQVITEKYTPTAGDRGAETQQAVGVSHFWQDPHMGWVRLNLTGMPVDANQAVAVSISEADQFGNEFYQLAKMSVYNVVVTPGVVTIRVFIDWGSPLHIRTHYVL